jgi:histidine triad (HIT) family protein
MYSLELFSLVSCLCDLLKPHGRLSLSHQQRGWSRAFSPHMEECIFCKIIKREQPAYILDENKDVLVFLSRENHPLVVPKKHLPDIYAVDEQMAAAVMVEAVKIARAVKRGLGCDGINLIQANEPAAQQDVFHFHVHVKPRWQNDTVILHWDMQPVSAEDLRVAMERIKEAFQ